MSGDRAAQGAGEGEAIGIGGGPGRATGRQIVMLLSRDIVRLIVLSTVIAVPLAWMESDAWLRNFAYRTTVGWWIFALSGVVALVIALATISWQAIKAALANPVTSLRME